MTAAVPQRATSPVWFGILAVAGGVYYAIPGGVMALLLRNQGYTPDQIQRVIAVAVVPATWSFAIAPIVDLGGRRRDWIIGSAVAAAVFLWPAIAWTSAPLPVRTVCLVTGGVATGFGGAAFGAMMTEFPANMRGRVSGWYEAGNLGGPALASGILLQLVPRVGANLLALAVCAAFLLPVLAIFGIRDPQRERVTVGLSRRFSLLLKESWEFIKVPGTWAGLLFLLSPAGIAGTDFTALTKEFRVSVNEVSLVTAFTGGISAAGSLVGGWVADRVGRPKAYIACGLLMAAASGSLAVAKLSPMTFALGVSVLALVSGISYAVSTAMVLQIVGGRRRLAATGFSVLDSVSQVPFAYMPWFCGSAYQSHGPRGEIAFDAISNFAAAVALSGFLVWFGRRWRRAFTD
jgi:MFS family permease